MLSKHQTQRRQESIFTDSKALQKKKLRIKNDKKYSKDLTFLTKATKIANLCIIDYIWKCNQCDKINKKFYGIRNVESSKDDHPKGLIDYLVNDTKSCP
jgi:hypothetical protein